MTSLPIRLTSVTEIKAFVEMTGQVTGDVDVRCGRYLVDGKSIMGMFSLDLSQPVTVEFHGEADQAQALSEALKPFLVVDP